MMGDRIESPPDLPNSCVTIEVNQESNNNNLESNNKFICLLIIRFN